MKRYLGVFLIIFASSLCMAQKAKDHTKWIYGQRIDAREFSYGVYVGLNSHSFHIAYREYIPSEEIGVISNVDISLGFLIDYKINEYFYLRFLPTWSSTNRTLFYPFMEKKENKMRVTKSDYISIPFLLKYNTKRYDNYRIYINAGMSLDKDFTAQNLGKGYFFDTAFPRVQLGGGVELYFRYVKITVDLRGVLSLGSELKGFDPNKALNKNVLSLRSQAFMIGIILQ